MNKTLKALINIIIAREECKNMRGADFILESLDSAVVELTARAELNPSLLKRLDADLGLEGYLESLMENY